MFIGWSTDWYFLISVCFESVFFYRDGSLFSFWNSKIRFTMFVRVSFHGVASVVLKNKG